MIPALILGYWAFWSKVSDGGSAGSVSVAASATGVVALNGAPWYEPYEYVVRASNAGGLGAPATLTATPFVSPIARPALNVVSVDHAGGVAEVTVGVVGDYPEYPVGWIQIPLYYSPSPTISPADTAHQVFDRLISVDVNTTLGEVVSAVITVTGLQEGVRYAFFRPEFHNQYGFSRGGNVEVSMSLRAPLAPTSLTAALVAANGFISLSWQPPASNDSSSLTAYAVFWSMASNGGNAGSVVVSAAASTRIVNVGQGNPRYTPYNFVVRAANAAGLGAPASVAATPEGVPQNAGHASAITVDQTRGSAVFRIHGAGTYPVDYQRLVVQYDLPGGGRRVDFAVNRACQHVAGPKLRRDGYRNRPVAGQGLHILAPAL